MSHERGRHIRGKRAGIVLVVIAAGLAVVVLHKYRARIQVERSAERELFALRAAAADDQAPAGTASGFDAWKEEAKHAARMLIVSAVDKTLGIKADGDAPALTVEPPAPSSPVAVKAPIRTDISLRAGKSGSVTPINETLAAWKQMDAVAPADPAAPAWVFDAAGSEPWSQDVLGVTVRGSRPGPQGEIVGYSAAYETNPEKARESARRCAVEGLKSLSIWRITGWKKKEGGLVTDGDYFLSVAGVSAFLDDLFQRDLHSLVRAWYDQRVAIHGEPMYRSAVLVRADDAKIKDILGEAGRTGQITRYARRREILSTTASALGLALVIFLLYSLLNAGTKGHFAWPLRFLSAGALAILFIGLMYMKGWFP